MRADRGELLKHHISTAIEKDWVDFWIMSLSMAGDDLSQWRGYVPGGQGGYAIGFNTKRLLGALKMVTKESVKEKTLAIPNLTRCWYIGKDENLISRLFDCQSSRYVDDLRKFNRRTRLDESDIRNTVASLLPAVMHLKHSAFSGEREVRIVLTPQGDDYSNVEILGNKPRLPVGIKKLGVPIHTLIDKVVVSPHGNRSSLWAEAEWLRKKVGGRFSVVLSEIPYDPSR